MNEWFARMMDYICKRFGRPDLTNLDDTIERYDHRITKVENDLTEQAARVRLLEMAGDPRGRRQPRGS